MKRLLMNPNNISAPFNTPDPGEDELLFVQMNEFEEKYKEKIPWIMSLSQQLVNQKNKNPEKNIETREHELEPAFHQEPRQPEKPKPSGTSRAAAQFKPLSPDVKKQVQFQAYKSTRPDLLTKLTSMITKGLFDLQRAYENDQKQNNNQIDLNNANSEILTNISQTKFLEEKFLIYSSAFERYIEESTLYKKVLEEIHDAYHEYIYNLQSRFSTGNDITVILERKDQEWQNKIQDMQQLNALKYQVSQETNKLLEKKIYHLENDKQRLENELCKSRESYSVIKKEYDEIRTSCVTLTSGLSRMEEEHRVYQTNETNRLTELSHSKATEQKLAEEIERLQQNLQNMEHIQSNMVNQEVVVTLEGTVESLKAEMKRMETTHRQLLLRYASIKSVVDECFKKWETENSSSIAQEKTRNAIQEVIRETTSPRSLRKESSRKGKRIIQDPIEKIMLIMETNGNPKIIIETMLDNITQNTTRSRFGGGGGGGYMDSDHNNNNFMPSLNLDDANSRQLNGTSAFDNDGSSAIAEEFKSPWTHFDGLGYTQNIPSFLKFSGKIQNISLSKKDIIRILQEMWEAKTAFDQYISNLQIIQAANREGESGSLFPSIGTGNLPDEGGGGEGNLLNTTALGGEDTKEKKDSPNPEESSKPPSRQQRKGKRPFSRAGTNSSFNNPSPAETATQANQELLNSGIISSSLIDSMPPNPSMVMFLECFLMDKLKDKLLSVEMAYNLYDALKKFSSLSDCRLFSAVLEEKLPTEIWDDQNNMVEKVRDEVNKEIKMLRSVNSNNTNSDTSTASTLGDNNAAGAGNANNNGNWNKINVEDLMRLIKRLFPTKSEHSFSKLQKAITMDNQNSRYVTAREILYEDTHGNRPHFLEQLKLQHITEAIAFEKHVMDCIDQFNELNDREMIISKYREALNHADPNKSRTEVNKLLSRATGLSIEEMLLAEAKRVAVGVEEFKLRLKSGLIQKSAPTGLKK